MIDDGHLHMSKWAMRVTRHMGHVYKSRGDPPNFVGLEILVLCQFVHYIQYIFNLYILNCHSHWDITSCSDYSVLQGFINLLSLSTKHLNIFFYIQL